MNLMLNANLRFWRRHPGQLLLTLIGIALGVAAVIAIDISESAARRSMLESVAAINRGATDHILGGPAGIDEQVFIELRMRYPDLAAQPLILRSLKPASTDAHTLRLLGTDLLEASAAGNEWLISENGEGPAWSVLLLEPSVAMSPALASRLGLRAGDALAVEIDGTSHRLKLAGLLTAAPGGTLDDLLIADISTAQEIVGGDRLSRIDLTLETKRQRARVAEWLPAGLRLERAESRLAAAQRLTDAFHLNLRALSLLAILMGALLIYNAQSFLVVQRLTMFARLRSLSVTSAQVFGYVIGEALLIGLAGTLLGLGVGIAASQGLIDVVSTTLSDLYYRPPIEGGRPAASDIVKATLIGVGAALLAGWLPAREACRVAPRLAALRSQQETAMQRRIRQAGCCGLIGIALGLVVLVASRGITAAFVSLFLLVGGMLMLTPLLVRRLLGIGYRACPRAWLRLRYDLRSVAASLSRTAIAITAVGLAIATTIGIVVMIDSFQKAVESWLNQLLRADLYVSDTAVSSRELGAGLPGELRQAFKDIPGVSHVTSARRVELAAAWGPVTVVAYQLHRHAFAGFDLLSGEPEAIWSRWKDGDVVIVSEPLARRQRLATGDRLALETPLGTRQFEIAGVFRDYSSDRGIAAMSRARYERYWPDDRVGGFGIYLNGADGPAVVRAMRSAHPGELEIIENAALKRESLAIFERTFAVTRILRHLAIAIAVLGLLSALLALRLEREREIAIVRSLGMTPGQVWRSSVRQSVLIALLAGLLAIPIGLFMAFFLTEVINLRSFAWSLELTVAPERLGIGLLTAMGAGLLAGLYPGGLAARVPLGEALRNE